MTIYYFRKGDKGTRGKQKGRNGRRIKMRNKLFTPEFPLAFATGNVRLS